MSLVTPPVQKQATTGDSGNGILPLMQTEHGAQNSTIVERLLAKLSLQSDLVLDFSSLKTCLNPLGIEDMQSDEQELDYEDLACDLIRKLPNLEKLTVRRLLKSSKPLKDEQFDRYAQINHGILQMTCLSELDLCDLPNIFHEQIQLWNLQNLKKLSITSSSLKSFPGSVGRLDKLEHLDLSNNHLSTLPITLAFCKNLRSLDLKKNKFRQLPGVIQRLHHLTTLRRFENPLTPIHSCQAPQYTRKISTSDKDTKKVFQPIGLQASCTKVIFASQVNYWETDAIGPLQCKTLDRLAAGFSICDNCNRMLSEQATKFQVEVLLFTFVGLSGVPFLFNACSETCQNELAENYGQKNVELQKKLDIEYEESIKEAQRAMEGDTSLLTQSGHAHRQHRTHRRRKRCSIM